MTFYTNKRFTLKLHMAYKSTTSIAFEFAMKNALTNLHLQTHMPTHIRT